jgi:flagellar hook-basal body complex protein FliE
MVPAIGSAAIQAMLTQIRSAVEQPKDSVNAIANAGQSLSGAPSTGSTPKADFAEALKNHLKDISSMEKQSNELGRRFALGDSSVNLSDVMVSSQKANIALQSSVQVRNKLATAYQTIMNMQI